MTNCHLCRKELGVLSKVKMDWLVFCRPCARKWLEQRKAVAMESLFRGGPPRHLFSIPRSAFIAPESPRGRVRLAGNLAFTDKGICFVAVSRTLKAGSWPLWLAPLGAGVPVIIFLVLDSAAKDRANMESRHGEVMVLEGASSFSEVLERAPRLVVVPREEIRRVKFGPGKVVVCTSGRKLVFGVPGDKETRTAYQHRVEDYGRVLETGGQFPTGPPTLPEK
jgi:hypothetical protein